LTQFLGILPRNVPIAFEPRHASWLDPRLIERLGRVGATLCVTGDESWRLFEATTPAFSGHAGTGSDNWAYLRLPAEIDANSQQRWIQRLASCDLKSAYIFFKHDDAGQMPDNARAFGERLAQHLAALREGSVKVGAGE
jgi:uncharacterized protein YecE (DUF72 family)